MQRDACRRFRHDHPYLANCRAVLGRKKLISRRRALPGHDNRFSALAVRRISSSAGSTFFPALSLGPIVDHR